MWRRTMHFPFSSQRVTQISAVARSVTSSQSGEPITTTMKYAAALCLLMICGACMGEDGPEESAPSSTAAPVSSSKKPEGTTKGKLLPEGRRVEITDAQLEMALKDKRYLQRQLKCTLGEAPCDPVGRRLRTLAPLVVRGSCPQCTPQETRQIQKVLLHMQRNFPKEWAKIVRTYQ